MRKGLIFAIILVLAFGFLLNYYLKKDIDAALLSILKGILVGLVAYFVKKIYENKRK